MVDLTKCKGGDCPFKENCYRYTAEACEYMQSYFVGPLYKANKEDEEVIKCEYFIQNYDDAS